MLETNVIPIEYDYKTTLEAEKLKEIIERNQMLFQIFLAGHTKISFLDSDEDTTLEITSIANFKELLSQFIPAHMEMLKNKVYSESGPEIDSFFLKMMLMDTVASKEDANQDKSLLAEINFNINTIYSLVGYTYYEEQKVNLIDFIFNPTGSEKEKIFKWLNRKERYNLMNMLLEEEYQKILELEQVENEDYLRTHLEELLELTELDIEERFKLTKGKHSNFPKLTQEELDKLCIEFLIKIDPSLKWLKIYNKLKENNNILYGEEFPDPCSKWGCIETTEEVYIYAPLEGNISDFMYFIHEFDHCISLIHKEKGECIPSSIQEFPPIFFERIATTFLREKGYCDKDVTSLEEQRLISTQSNKSDISPSLRYLIDYLNKGPITYIGEKEKMDRIRNAIPDDLPKEMHELLNNIMSTQDEENVHKKVDVENSFLIEHPDCVFEEYPYIVGYELAEATMFKVSDNPMLIYTVLSITENLTKENYASVCSKLGFATTVKDNSTKHSLQHVKKRTTNKN